MAHRLKLALIACLLCSPVEAGGSMANPVKVIVVHRPDRADQLRRETEKAHAAEAKSAAKEAAAKAKAWAAAEKARLKAKKPKK